MITTTIVSMKTIRMTVIMSVNEGHNEVSAAEDDRFDLRSG